MKILFAGANGAIGRNAVPLLLEDGHDVLGTANSPAGLELLSTLGVPHAALDVNDARAVRETVSSFAPDVIVNMTTALRTPPDFRKLDRSMTSTNELRVKGTDHLLTAGTDAGVKRHVGQSFAGWWSARPSDPGGEPAPLMQDPPRPGARTVGALAHLEAAVKSWPGSGIVLRFGPLYGPGTSLGAGGHVLADVHKGKIPVIGKGQGIWSFCHVEDAGRAVALAVRSEATGVVEVVDSEPAPVAEWLPTLADMVGARSPRHLPGWLAAAVVGPVGMHVMTQAHPASNVRARDLLGLVPRYDSWRTGFATGLGQESDPAAR